jgi:hypothetical protein
MEEDDDNRKILDLIIEYPNDMDLGKQIRSLFREKAIKQKLVDDNSSRL